MKARALALAALVLAASACIPKDALKPRFYSIDAPQPPTGDASSGMVVSLSNVLVAPAYAGRPFVYRIGAHGIEHDYYASFAAAPGQMLTAAVRGYLRDAPFIRDVVAPGEGLPAIATIDVYASELCAELEPGGPTAVLTLQFRVVAPGAESPPAIREILIRTYTERVPMSQRSAAAAAEGWNTALAGIMKSFVADVQPVLAEARATTPAR
jgi:hypothetical protein